MNFDVNTLIPHKDRIEVQAKKKQQVEYKFIGSMKHNRSHILFAINTVTGDIHPAEYKENKIIEWKDALAFAFEGKMNKEVVVEKDCIYIEALNLENAVKKYNKMKLYGE